ncbi:MAG: hypothetical protein COU31_01140 [Candidatus Magasanikbacteria bacterium CG10_big_fil_rev_8_21_14_0_10_40_10]|uniref:Uncharacterized protein n=1 Tax=Candidatus Magasanikbacteria bacterium CG10_big_fil_rev_8_21_14_0_10_40_10 TaxID=1974648 RepID=A0A2M6W4Q0_9BACT|nr:MAG: hypothetical protein COU31_01140 [Candidatus Magasanikbacteria bacterium CG10_big_fil_rev_8_21_14_0_10_40_10]
MDHVEILSHVSRTEIVREAIYRMFFQLYGININEYIILFSKTESGQLMQEICDYAKRLREKSELL